MRPTRGEDLPPPGARPREGGRPPPHRGGPAAAGTAPAGGGVGAGAGGGGAARGAGRAQGGDVPPGEGEDAGGAVRRRRDGPDRGVVVERMARQERRQVGPDGHGTDAGSTAAVGDAERLV